MLHVLYSGNVKSISLEPHSKMDIETGMQYFALLARAICDNERLRFCTELVDETLFALHSIVMFCNTTSTIHKSEGKQD